MPLSLSPSRPRIRRKRLLVAVGVLTFLMLPARASWAEDPECNYDNDPQSAMKLPSSSDTASAKPSKPHTHKQHRAGHYVHPSRQLRLGEAAVAYTPSKPCIRQRTSDCSASDVSDDTKPHTHAQQPPAHPSSLPREKGHQPHRDTSVPEHKNRHSDQSGEDILGMLGSDEDWQALDADPVAFEKFQDKFLGLGRVELGKSSLKNAFNTFRKETEVDHRVRELVLLAMCAKSQQKHFAGFADSAFDADNCTIPVRSKYYYMYLERLQYYSEHIVDVMSDIRANDLKWFTRKVRKAKAIGYPAIEASRERTRLQKLSGSSTNSYSSGGAPPKTLPTAEKLTVSGGFGGSSRGKHPVQAEVGKTDLFGKDLVSRQLSSLNERFGTEFYIPIVGGRILPDGKTKVLAY